MTPSGLSDLIARTRHVLLDFDGPLCSVFAGVTSRASPRSSLAQE
jgi:hypothetical protein